MPADILTTAEAGSAAGAQTSAAQQAIGSLTDTTNQGAGYLRDYTDNGINALKTYVDAANQGAVSTAGLNIGQIQTGVNNATAYYAPYLQSGGAASALYNNLIGAGANGIGGEEAALAATPGYQFTLNQGLKAQQNSATAQGLGVSGAALKAGTQFATGLADSTYQNQVNNALAGMGIGGQAASGAAGATVSGFGDIANAYNNFMNTFSNNALTGGTGIANLYGQGGNALLNAYSNLGQHVANQYTNIGNAKATADYATAQAFQNTEAELISAAGSSGKMGA